jgi:hypothetical protein
VASSRIAWKKILGRKYFKKMAGKIVLDAWGRKVGQEVLTFGTKFLEESKLNPIMERWIKPISCAETITSKRYIESGNSVTIGVGK